VSGDDRERLIEEAATAWRARDPRDGRMRPHHAWADLDEAGRQEAWAAAEKLRRLEAAADPDGLSAAARAVLRRIR
jgi:hypothetical protein